MTAPSDNLIQEFANNPEKWATANKEHIAKSLSTTVEELEARIAKYVAEAPKPEKASDITLPDMSPKVECGNLGKWSKERLGSGPEPFPIAYRWPAMLSAFSQHITPHPDIHANSFTVLIGISRSGKGEVQKRANILANLRANGLLLSAKRGSIEGMIEHLGKMNGQPLLFFPGELAHLMRKSKIENSGFLTMFNDLWDDDDFDITISRGRRFQGSVRLSLAGGIVPTSFEDCFGSESVGGFLNRFLLGVCPHEFDGRKPWKYLYRPMEGEPISGIAPPDTPFVADAGMPSTEPIIVPYTRLKTPRIHNDVWEARDGVVKDDSVEEGVTSLVLRAAVTCCAFDEIPEISASYLEPFWELARYQMEVRKVFKPNEGEDFDAIVSNKILGFLSRHVGKWMRWRDVYQQTRILVSYGMPRCERARDALYRAGAIEKTEAPQAKGGHKAILVRMVDQGSND